MSGEIIRPTFLQANFLFDGRVPPHHDAEPHEPRLSDAFGILLVGAYPMSEARMINNPYHTIALDISDLPTTEVLVRARIARTEMDVRMGKPVPNIQIYKPNGSFRKQVYRGWGHPEA